MKICQDISQEMAKIQNVIDQFKELAEKVAKAGSKEEMNKLQSEFARLKAENLDECIKQQQKLKALNMNFQGELEKKLGMKKGELHESVKFYNDGYLIGFKVPNNSDISEINLSETKITMLNFTYNTETKTLKTKNLPKTLQELNVKSSDIDLSENNLSETEIIELDFYGNKGTKSLKTEFLPKHLKKINLTYSRIDLSNHNLSETEIIELDFYGNKGTKTLKTEFLPKNLKKLNVAHLDIDLSNHNLLHPIFPPIY